MTRFITTAALTVLLAACNTPTNTVPGTMPPGGETAFTVNGDVVTQDMVDATLRRLPDEVREQLEQNNEMDQVYKDIALSELLYQKALETKLHEDPKMAVDLAMAQRSALAGEYVERIVDERLTPEATRKWYDDHLVQYANAQAFVRLIVAEDLAAANAIKAEAEAGADFAELAKTRSKDPRTAPNGGELGWMSKKDMPREMATVVFSGEKGAIIDPVETPNGVLLFKIEDKRDNTPFEEVEEEVKNKAKQEILDGFIKEMREQVEIVKPGDAGKAEVTVPDDKAPAEKAPAEGAVEGAAEGE